MLAMDSFFTYIMRCIKQQRIKIPADIMDVNNILIGLLIDKTGCAPSQMVNLAFRYNGRVANTKIQSISKTPTMAWCATWWDFAFLYCLLEMKSDIRYIIWQHWDLSSVNPQ